MNDTSILTDRFGRALWYTTHIHREQVRKSTAIPYVAHLLAVAAIVLEHGGDEDLAIAALLHDSVEDQGGQARLNDVRGQFGDRVAHVVEECSDSLADTTKGEQKTDWRTRREAYLARLDSADDDVLRVSLADKVHNASAILRDLKNPRVGENVWSRFNAGRDDTLWFYRSLAAKFRERLQESPLATLANELNEIVEALGNHSTTLRSSQ